MEPRKGERIASYRDLLEIGSRIDGGSNIRGKVKVFPGKEYVVTNPDDFQKMIRKIPVYSSMYASMSGVLYMDEEDQ